MIRVTLSGKFRRGPDRRLEIGGAAEQGEAAAVGVGAAGAVELSQTA
jgi:hypothetical protein